MSKAGGLRVRYTTPTWQWVRLVSTLYHHWTENTLYHQPGVTMTKAGGLRASYISPAWQWPMGKADGPAARYNFSPAWQWARLVDWKHIISWAQRDNGQGWWTESTLYLEPSVTMGKAGGLRAHYILSPAWQWASLVWLKARYIITTAWQ